MTNYIKVNGEWIKNRVYAIVDAAHTRFSSTKFTATNVSDALDEIADSISNVDNTSDADKPISTAVSAALGGKEDSENKVTSISSSSTDDEYPSAKCVYDALQDAAGTYEEGKGIAINNNEISLDIDSLDNAVSSLAVGDYVAVQTGGGSFKRARKLPFNLLITTLREKLVATASLLGLVKPDGTTITVDSTGVISANVSGGTAEDITYDPTAQHTTGSVGAELASLDGRVDDVEDVIPAQATEQNKLADKSFVNSSVQTATANFRGNWESWADVPTDSTLYPVDYAGSKVPTVNDYLVVQDASDYEDDTLDGTWRFKYSGEWSTDGKDGWHPEYQVNETPLTSDQLAALNSGITSGKVGGYDSHLASTSNPHSVTAAQVGLSNVDNTSDADKPISTAVSAALASKQDTLIPGENITIVDNVISASGGSGGIPLDPDSTVDFAIGYDDGGLYIVTEDE